MDNLESIQIFKKHGTNLSQMGRLCQRVGKGKNGLGKIVEGTNTSYVIRFEDISKDRLNEIFYNSIACEVRPGKMIQIVHKSQYVAQISATQGTPAPAQLH